MAANNLVFPDDGYPTTSILKWYRWASDYYSLDYRQPIYWFCLILFIWFDFIYIVIGVEMVNGVEIVWKFWAIEGSKDWVIEKGGR